MPLRQTLLSFAAALTSPRKADPKPPTRPKNVRSNSATSSDASDVIEVEVTEAPIQLPTPSETATEASSVSSRQDASNKASRRGSKRLSRGKGRASVLQSPQKEQVKDRTVSGETLVNSASVSQDSLVKSGIDKLDLPWNMSDVFNKGSKADLLDTGAEDDNASQKSKATAEEDSEEDDEEDEAERAARAAAKKAKMAQNNKLWEKRRKMAAKNATRKSSRASMLTKAGEFAESVLEKRASRVSELKSLARPRSASEAQILDNAVDGPDAKKRRVSDGAALTSSQSAPVLSSKKVQRAPKDKKWLISGLYAGQQRAFDARHHGGKNNNKRKSGAVEEDEKKENSVLPMPMFFGERLLKEGRDFKLPFDVFSPLPPGQPKPDEWRKSNKNVFVGDAAAEWRVAKQMEYSACLCKPDTGCDADCMNRYMYYECDSRNCTLTPEQCGNRAFEDLRARAKKGGKYNIGVEVIKTTNRGYGVRSNRTFEPNQIIVEYSGEVINQDECDRRMKKEYKKNECYYLMLFDQNMIIDATTKGSIARFVNHSCNPNCRMEKWTVGGKPRMALFAGDRGIMTGEELTYDYNFDPFSQKNVQECHCGEAGCRGFLGPKQKKDERKSEEKEGEQSKSPKKSLKRKMVEMVEDVVDRVTKKQKTDTKAVVQSRTKTRVYSNATSPAKKSAFGAKVRAAAKAVRGDSTSPMKATTGLARNPSKLKRMVQSTKEATSKAKASASAGIQKSRSTRRIISSTSATEALIEKEVSEEKSIKKLVKSKTGSVKENAVRTVRGRQSGRTRTMRVIDGEE